MFLMILILKILMILTKVAALMILSAWGLSTIIWVPAINAWPYIEGKPNLDKETVGSSR